MTLRNEEKEPLKVGTREFTVYEHMGQLYISRVELSKVLRVDPRKLHIKELLGVLQPFKFPGHREVFYAVGDLRKLAKHYEKFGYRKYAYLLYRLIKLLYRKAQTQ